MAKVKNDVVFVLGDVANDGPLHVELLAQNVEGEKAALRQVIRQMTDVDTAGGTGEVVAWEEDGSLWMEVSRGKARVTVQVRLDAERIEDNAQAMAYPAAE